MLIGVTVGLIYWGYLDGLPASSPKQKWTLWDDNATHLATFDFETSSGTLMHSFCYIYVRGEPDKW